MLAAMVLFCRKKKRLLPVVVVKPVSKGEERGATKRPRSEPAQEGEAQPPGGEEKQPAGADEQREGGVHEEERHEESEDQGLGGLLGGYGSDGSDASGDGAPDEGQKAVPPPLPSAADLLS